MPVEPTNDDLRDLEDAFAVLKPAPLDAEFLSRLVACSEAESTKLSSAELQFEDEVRHHHPARLSPAMMARLESVVADVAFPDERKILPFPQRSQAPPKAARSSRAMLAAVAAVAAVGAAAALLVPVGDRPSPAITESSPVRPQASAAVTTTPREVLPASFQRSLRSARDEGVVLQSKDRSHRLVRVEFIDRVWIEDGEGKSVEVEQPRVGYFLVPESVD